MFSLQFLRDGYLIGLNEPYKNVCLSMGNQERYPLYLIVADKTKEFDTALHYAAKAALFNGARLAVLCVMPDSDRIFVPWRRVSDHIDEEKRLVAENFLDEVSAKLNQYNLTPVLYLRSGKPTDVVRDLVNGDKGITKLILSGDTSRGSPGTLVSYFSGRGLSEINVPLTIIPSHITDGITQHFFEQID